MDFGHARIDFVLHELLKKEKRLRINVHESRLLKYFLERGERASPVQPFSLLHGDSNASIRQSIDACYLKLRELYDVTCFSNSAKQHDDMTVVVDVRTSNVNLTFTLQFRRLHEPTEPRLTLS